MNIEEQKQYVKDFAKLNKRTREILKKMQHTTDKERVEELRMEMEENTRLLDEYKEMGYKIVGEMETHPTDIVTPMQAQRIWDIIRNKIRLAKFNDAGIELPEIDMKKLFHGRKYVTPEDINAQLQDIINRWEPPMS